MGAVDSNSRARVRLLVGPLVGLLVKLSVGSLVGLLVGLLVKSSVGHFKGVGL